MPSIVEPQDPGSFIVREGSFSDSRKDGRLAVREAIYLDGTILVQDGLYLRQFAIETDVWSDVAGILVGNHGAVLAPKRATYVCGNAEVQTELLQLSVDSFTRANEMYGLQLLGIRFSPSEVVDQPEPPSEPASEPPSEPAGTFLTLNSADVLGAAIGYYPSAPGPFGSVSGAMYDGITLQKDFYYIAGTGFNIIFEPPLAELINADLHLEIDGVSYAIPENRIAVSVDEITINPLTGVPAIAVGESYQCRLIPTVQVGPCVITPALASGFSFTGFLRGGSGFGAGTLSGANIAGADHPLISAFHDPSGNRFIITFLGEDANDVLGGTSLEVNGGDPLAFDAAIETNSNGATQYQWDTTSGPAAWEWTDLVGVPQTLTIVP